MWKIGWPLDPQSGPRLLRIALQTLSAAGIIYVAVMAVAWGLLLRDWAWHETSDVHFENSLHNAIFWGDKANDVGIQNVYPQLIDESNGGENLNQDPGGGPLPLDYPPLRLMIAAKWAAVGESWVRSEDEKKLLHEHQKRHQPLVLTARDRATLDRLSQQRLANRRHWRSEYEFNRFMLDLNTACELAGSIAMFLLVHLWLRRCAGAPSRQWVQPLRCAWPALFAAVLLWFSPAVIFNAHCYEQWDCYSLAPFLLAIYFGMLNRWLISGMLIGFVSMAKGQILIVVPAIVIWQLLMMHPLLAIRQIKCLIVERSRTALGNTVELLAAPFGAVLRLGTGIALAIGIVASPWLVNNSLASTWVLSVGLGLMVMLPLFFLRGSLPLELFIRLGLIGLAAALILWPWANLASTHTAAGEFGDFTTDPPGLELAMGCVLALGLSARFLPRRLIFSWAAVPMAGALFACYPIFKTNMDWYLVGIKFASEHWQMMEWCHPMNLGALLENRFGWEFGSTINLAEYLTFIPQAWFLKANLLLAHFESLPKDGEPAHSLATLPIIPVRYLMMAAYLITMSISAVGMAIQYRRRNRNFLFAMVAPWLLMFALLPQMQNRYLVWAAAFTAATAAFSMDGFLLFLLLNAISVVNTLWDMCHWTMGRLRASGGSSATVDYWMPMTRDARGNPKLGGIGPLYPDLGWMVLLLAAIYLYLGLRKNRRTIPIDWPAVGLRVCRFIATAPGRVRRLLPSKSPSRSEPNVSVPLPA